jgi:glycosyltransferase involved in cell wall biosynthesis
LTSTGPPRLVRVVTRMNIGGPARHVTILAARCGPEFDGALLAGESEDREGSLANEAAQLGVSVVRVPHLRRSLSPVADILAFTWLLNYFRTERPSIVATHMAKAGTLGRIAAALTGVPVIVHTFHGHVLDGYFGRLSTSFFLAVERLLSHLTTQFIAISPEVAAELDRLDIGRGKTTIVRLGLDLQHLTSHQPGQLRRELAVPTDAPLVGIVGRLVPIKALDLFLDAVSLVAKDDPDVHFAIVGDGELWDQLHQDVQTRGLAKRVHFTGWRRDLAAVYSDLDVVVCCSRNEGTPVSLIEACAAGRAVVGTQVGGIPDIIAPGLNGLLVPRDDAGALAAAIAELIADPARRRSMGLAGRQMVMERHSADRMVSELKDIYGRLLERASPKAEPA